MGDAAESGRDAFFAKSCEPDILRSKSNASGFFGSSGVALLYWPDAIRGDLAGGVGFSVMDCLAGVFVTFSSSGGPLALEGTELGRTCSVFTKGIVARLGVTFSGGVFSDSVVALVAGALLFGPRARPLVMCCSSGAGPVFVSCDESFTGDSVPSALDVDLLVVNGGGPRASIPASAGLKRSASLLAFAGSLDVNSGAGCTGLSLTAEVCERRLFFLARASGVTSFGFSGGGGFDPLSARPRAPLLAIASGVGAGSVFESDRLREEPVSCAFN